MVNFTASITVPYARQRVWPVLSDWTNLSRWDINIKTSTLAAEEASDAPQKEGTCYDCTFAMGQNIIPVAYKCVRMQPMSECQFQGLARLFRSVDTLSFEEMGDAQTRVTASFELNFRGLLAPFSFVMGGAMRDTGPIVMKDIAKFLDDELGC